MFFAEADETSVEISSDTGAGITPSVLVEHARSMQNPPTAMGQAPVAEWLRRSIRTQLVANALGSLGMLLAGLALVAVTWGFAYVVSLFALGSWLGFHHWSLVVAPSVLVPLLFWGNARTSQEYLSE